MLVFKHKDIFVCQGMEIKYNDSIYEIIKLKNIGNTKGIYILIGNVKHIIFEKDFDKITFV